MTGPRCRAEVAPCGEHLQRRGQLLPDRPAALGQAGPIMAAGVAHREREDPDGQQRPGELHRGRLRATPTATASALTSVQAAIIRRLDMITSPRPYDGPAA
ncbi:hypothetical protein GCM10022251_28080 [Phytohabitans flavus]|uniref:Uncharacterized protein n=1 Tax=Phytohabitans flavus TaxID=1076124 RepID=A0A6F8XP58_9ACTN|nr:hypothetical protein [Phytohabitans flavus]BCB75579.1 hypothetical protein Pflav_019890 [Phytohabitans flavus]